ncbi:MAG: hypothetical protein ACW99F_07800 [Candidatus Hodarchaeales archaeon]|jgi:hypothetical protein
MRAKLWMKSSIIGVSVLIFLLLPNVFIANSLTVVEVKYHSSVTKGAKFIWNIDTVVTVDGNDSWKWEWANNVELKQGDNIALQWTENPDETTDIGIGGPLIYSGLEVVVGDRKLDFTKYETFFNFLVTPLYVNNSLGRLESGFISLERFWFTSYHLPSAYLPPEYTEYIWNFNMINGSLKDTENNRNKGTVAFGFVTTQDFFDSNSTDPETYVFDVFYTTETGLVKSFKYPSSGLYDFPVANSSHDMTKGLVELVISYVGKESDSVPSFTLPMVLGVIIIMSTIVKIRNKKRKID